MSTVREKAMAAQEELKTMGTNKQIRDWAISNEISTEQELQELVTVLAELQIDFYNTGVTAERDEAEGKMEANE